MLVPRTKHIALRPSFDCASCGRPWPCANARSDLIEQYQGWPTGLGLYMASCLYEAIEVCRANVGLLPADLFERFLGWVRPANMLPDVTQMIRQAQDGRASSWIIS